MITSTLRNEYSVEEFGAVPDGQTNNAFAIQEAIDECAEAGGGRVTISPGVFKSGKIILRSRVELYFAVDRALPRPDNPCSTIRSSSDPRSALVSDGVLFSKAAVKRVVAGMATVAAVALTVESTIGNLPEQLDLRGAIPQNLRPDEYVVGVPWTGDPGRVVTVAELEAATAREPKVAGPIERRREQSGASEHLIKTSNPEAPAVAQWPFAGPSPVVRDLSLIHI